MLGYYFAQASTDWRPHHHLRRLLPRASRSLVPSGKPSLNSRTAQGASSKPNVQLSGRFCTPESISHIIPFIHVAAHHPFLPLPHPKNSGWPLRTDLLAYFCSLYPSVCVLCWRDSELTFERESSFRVVQVTCDIAEGQPSVVGLENNRRKTRPPGCGSWANDGFHRIQLFFFPFAYTASNEATLATHPRLATQAVDPNLKHAMEDPRPREDTGSELLHSLRALLDVSSEP